MRNASLVAGVLASATLLSAGKACSFKAFQKASGQVTRAAARKATGATAGRAASRAAKGGTAAARRAESKDTVGASRLWQELVDPSHLVSSGRGGRDGSRPGRASVEGSSEGREGASTHSPPSSPLFNTFPYTPMPVAPSYVPPVGVDPSIYEIEEIQRQQWQQWEIQQQLNQQIQLQQQMISATPSYPPR